MAKNAKEKRSSDRYQANVDLKFSFCYDLETELKYKIVEDKDHKADPDIHKGTSKNISLKGLCFQSPVELHKGERLKVELLLPIIDSSVLMEGVVAWSQKADDLISKDYTYETGIEIQSVKGEPVKKSIYYDKEYHVYWSSVLESVLGKYRESMQERKK